MNQHAKNQSTMKNVTNQSKTKESKIESVEIESIAVDSTESNSIQSNLTISQFPVISNIFSDCVHANAIFSNCCQQTNNGAFRKTKLHPVKVPMQEKMI